MSIKLTDKIQFNNIEAPGKKMGQVLSKSGYKDLSNNIIDDEYEGQIQKPSPVINAVDIDWNGAELELPEELGGTKTINTTGELLKERLQHNSPMFAKVA